MNCNPTPAKITQRSLKPQHLKWRPLLLHLLPIPISILLSNLLKNNIFPRHSHPHNLLQNPLYPQPFPPIISMSIPHTQHVFSRLDTQCDPRDFIISDVGKGVTDEG
jgi:hypothetical protein